MCVQNFRPRQRLLASLYYIRRAEVTARRTNVSVLNLTYQTEHLGTLQHSFVAHSGCVCALCTLMYVSMKCSLGVFPREYFTVKLKKFERN